MTDLPQPSLAVAAAPVCDPTAAPDQYPGNGGLQHWHIDCQQQQADRDHPKAEDWQDRQKTPKNKNDREQDAGDHPARFADARHTRHMRRYLAIMSVKSGTDTVALALHRSQVCGALTLCKGARPVEQKYLPKPVRSQSCDQIRI